jgi:hypothetical protein
MLLWGFQWMSHPQKEGNLGTAKLEEVESLGRNGRTLLYPLGKPCRKDMAVEAGQGVGLTGTCDPAELPHSPEKMSLDDLRVRWGGGWQARRSFPNTHYF